MMDLQAEPLSQEGLKHHFELSARGSGRNFGLDIVLLILQPPRPQNLLSLRLYAVVRHQEQAEHREALDRNPLWVGGPRVTTHLTTPTTRRH
jgi:hypothetical protein